MKTNFCIFIHRSIIDTRSIGKFSSQENIEDRTREMEEEREQKNMAGKKEIDEVEWDTEYNIGVNVLI